VRLTPNISEAPFKGAASTVSAVREAVLKSQRVYSVRQAAEAITRGLRSKDYVSEALAIYQWVCDHTRYARDPRTIELVRAPYIVLGEIADGHTPGIDCDDLCALIAALCMSLGHRVRAVTVAQRHIFFQGERQYTHIFCQVQDPRTGAWLTLDPVARRADQMMRSTVAMKFWPIA
jgi:hypothetical protein